MRIKINSYETARFTGGNLQPLGGYDYKAPDGTLWNAGGIIGNTVQLWTINAWGSTHRQSVNRYEFERTWTRYSAEPTITPRLSWRTKSDQFYQSSGCGQLHHVRFMGTCESCGRSVYSHGCAGERPCGDVVEASPDPRGIIPSQHCMNLYRAVEYGLSGRDVVTCYACAEDGNRYRATIAGAKERGTWTA